EVQLGDRDPDPNSSRNLQRSVQGHVHVRIGGRVEAHLAGVEHSRGRCRLYLQGDADLAGGGGPDARSHEGPVRGHRVDVVYYRVLGYGFGGLVVLDRLALALFEGDRQRVVRGVRVPVLVVQGDVQGHLGVIRRPAHGG